MIGPGDAVRAYFKAYETGSPEAVLAHLAPDHVYHGPAGAAPMGYAGRRAETGAFFAAFSEVRVEIADQIVDGDRVATRLVMQAVHSGPYGGFQPTGRPVVMPFIDLARVRSGLVAEEWAEFDVGAIVRQIS